MQIVGKIHLQSVEGSPIVNTQIVTTRQFDRGNDTLKMNCAILAADDVDVIDFV
jgi:hypothetical protein